MPDMKLVGMVMTVALLVVGCSPNVSNDCRTLPVSSYKGSVNNTTVGIKASTDVTLQQSGCKLTGIMLINKPLIGGGPINGSITKDKVYFKIDKRDSDAGVDLVFTGTISESGIKGTYQVPERTQSGEWELTSAIGVSRAIILRGDDFPHPVNIVTSAPFRNATDKTAPFELVLAGLDRQAPIDSVADGYYIWAHEPQRTRSQASHTVRAWVMVLNDRTAVQKLFALAAAPRRATADMEGRSTGERELATGKLGEESRVFDRQYCDNLTKDCHSSYRIVARQKNVVLILEGSYFGGTETSPAYYINLMLAMINRIP